MTVSGSRRRLALAAPLVQLAVGSALLALAARPAQLLVPAVAVALIVPALIGILVFRERPLLHRFLLGAWAPAGAMVLFFLILFGMRFLSGGSTVFFWAIVAGPLAVLLALGLVKLRGAPRRTWVAALVLWVLAIAEAAAALPLSQRFDVVGDMRSLAGTLLLLFAPGVAFGAWGGLALAARAAGAEPADAVAGDGAHTEAAPHGTGLEPGQEAS